MRWIHPRSFVLAVLPIAAAFAGCSSSSSSSSDNTASDAAPRDAHGQSDSGAHSSKDSGQSQGKDAAIGSDASQATTNDAGSVGGVPGGQLGVGTTIGSCTIFPADDPWNVEIDGPSVQVIHTYDSQLSPGTKTHPDLGGYTSDTGGIPINIVDASQADLPTVFSVYAGESDPGPGGWVGANPVTTGASIGTTAYPFFVGMKIEGDPSAGGTPGNLPGDQHAIVLQQGANGCTSYEAWNCAVVSSPPFQCANGSVFDLATNPSRPAGWTSADAAGLAILPGLVRLSEVMAGNVTHAARMTFSVTQSGYIAPATHAAGSKPLGSAYPPMGLRLRLKASVSTASYTAASQVIMAGLKKYGLIVADNGSDWFFQGDSDDGWLAMAPDGQDTLVDEVVGDFRNLTGADFEAVYTGDPVATGL